MKTSTLFGCLGCLSVLASCTHQGVVSQTKPGGTRTRVGVYDSRSIAIAFVGSAVYKATDGKVLADLKAEYDKAKAEGDRDRMAELEAKGKGQQALLHKQGFSTAPVDGMLAHVKDQMADIAEDEGVEAIVSMWDKEALARYDGAELVDVTMPLVDAFKPNDRQRESAIEIREHPPISLKQAEKIED